MAVFSSLEEKLTQERIAYALRLLWANATFLYLLRLPHMLSYPGTGIGSGNSLLLTHNQAYVRLIELALPKQ